METSALVLTLIGSIILVIGFIPQTKKVYTLKHTYGISKVSWVQNYLGRIVFPLYLAFTPASLSVIPTAVGQLLVGLMSVPMIYYIFRNHKTQGEYKKELFDIKKFIIRISLSVFLVVSGIVIILMSANVDIIKIGDRNTDFMKIFTFIFGIIATALVSTAFIPQSFKTIKTKNTKSTSLLLTIMFTIGNTLIMLSFLLRTVSAAEKGIHDWRSAIDVLKYVGPLIFINMGSLAMITIITIKVKNVKVNGEKI